MIGVVEEGLRLSIQTISLGKWIHVSCIEYIAYLQIMFDANNMAEIRVLKPMKSIFHQQQRRAKINFLMYELFGMKCGREFIHVHYSTYHQKHTKEALLFIELDRKRKCKLSCIALPLKMMKSLQKNTTGCTGESPLST